ncbi:MAG: TMEM175 family protein [Phenylobacterium sp.]
MNRAAPAGPDITPGRLGAFSDGVIAIIITIMVLELRPPAETHWRAVVASWPDFVSYLISFAFVATYWVNHRHIIRRLAETRERIVWMNVVLLFMISLIPFSTAYMGRSGLAAFPMALYAAVLLVCGMCFAVLRAMIAAEMTPAQRRTFNGPRVQVIGAATALMLLAAMGLSFLNPPAALAIIVASSLLHIAPFTRVG